MNALPTDISGLSDRILDVIPDMFVVYDRNATILDIRHPKPGLTAFTGPQASAGGQLTEKVQNVLPESFMKHFRYVCDTGQPRQFVYRCKKDGDTEESYEVFLSCLEHDRILADIRNMPEGAVSRIGFEHLHGFFTGVLENIAIPVAVKSVETGRYLYWSKKAEIFGRTAEEMIGAREDLFMPPEKARMVQQIGRQLAEGKEKQYEGIEKYTIGDGKEHTFFITRTLFTFGAEKLIMVSALDISELQETQTSLLYTKAELANKNMTLSSVLSLARVIPWQCDLVNRTFYCDYSAYHPENAKGPDGNGCYVIPMEHYFASIHPHYRQEAIRMIDDLVEGRREEFHDTYQVHWFNDREWEWVQVQSSVSRRSADGRPLQLTGSAQCVTEQKATEQALREVKENLNLQNVILSSVLNLAKVIPWGYDPVRQVFYCDYDAYHHETAEGPDREGQYMVSVEEYFVRIHPDYRAHAFDLFKDLMEGRIPDFHEIYPVRWKNDREYEWVEIQCSASKYSPAGEFERVIGSARVVTSQKRMEESLREAKEQAEHSNTLKSAFLANMSHEIRTPLNAIVGFSELLAHSEEEEEKQEYLAIIRNSNALLLQLIGDILDLSKIEAGTLDFSFADHNLNALMEELEQTARMKVTNPAVEVSCTGVIPGCTIHTDRGRLLQVLHNFINNAAKFTQRGHVYFGYRKQADGRWYFYVEDTGCGIPGDKADTVFERFVKLDGKMQGTGLGLAISKSIIERLGGEIGVSSVAGLGSTFWFVLPADSISTTATAIATVEKPLPAFCKAAGPTSILVAEDDPANYKLFEAMLRKHYTLLHAWNGREAVEMFKIHHPNMILMDIKMPEMDGYEATAAIRKLSADVPIVAVTAFAYPEDMRRILASGFNGCLPKPVNADNLKKKISEMCTGQEEEK